MRRISDRLDCFARHPPLRFRYRIRCDANVREVRKKVRGCGFTRLGDGAAIVGIEWDSFDDVGVVEDGSGLAVAAAVS